MPSSGYHRAMRANIPLSLYVHMPWCVSKCPYCDFNSHGLRGAEPDHAGYVDALVADLDGDLADFGEAVAGREIVSVFLGGGTPSLFPPAQIGRLLEAARGRLRSRGRAAGGRAPRRAGRKIRARIFVRSH